MESNTFIYKVKSFTSQNRQLTSFELKEIKQLLLSRDKEKISRAVNQIQSFIDNANVMIQLIMSDIPAFLCDATSSCEPGTVSNVYACLEKMAQHEEFFSHSHSSFVIESLIRSVHFLVKNKWNENGLNESFSLLIIILQGYNVNNLIPEKKPIETLVQLISELLSNDVLIEIKHHIGLVIEGILNLSLLKLNKATVDCFFKCISKWFGNFNVTLDDINPSTGQIVGLGCSLSAKTLSFLSDADIFSQDFDSTSNDLDFKSNIISNIVHFLIRFGAPYIANLPLCDKNMDLATMENFFQALIHVYEKISPQKNQLAQHLSGMGFLHYITKIISFADERHGRNLRKLCLIALSKIILSLSDDIFQFPQMWPAGRDEFHEEILNGMSQLPLDASQWLDELSSIESHRSSKLALIVYLYFYSLTAKSPDVTGTIYPAIVTFLNSSSGIGSSILLVKTVWFIYVMSQLSKNSNTDDNSDEATKKMVLLLEDQDQLDLVYTHHPALLYWTFSSSKISYKIQCRVVRLWLQNRTPDCRALDELIKESSDVRFALFDILQSGAPKVIESAFSSLKALLIESEDDNLASNVWYLLPQVMAKYTTDSTLAINVDYFIELATLKTPTTPDISKVVRTAGLLPDVVSKSNLISIIPSLKLTFQLLQLSIEMEDYRVAQAYFRSDGFLQKIIDGIRMNEYEIVILSLKITTLLWKSQNEINSCYKSCKPKFDINIMLRVITEIDEEVISAALELIEEMLTSEFQSAIFHIVGSFNSTYIRILFYHLQNICVKSFSEVSSQCWTCLKYCLMLNSIDTEIVSSHLMNNPWMHEVIKLCLANLPESQEFREFLIVWLDLNNSRDDIFDPGRAISSSYFAETVTLIANGVLRNNIPNERILCQKILESGVELQLDVREELDSRCRDE